MAQTKDVTGALLDFEVTAIENCIAWAAQHDYTGAKHSAAALGNLTGREMVLDQPYYNSYVWCDRT